MQRIQKLYQRRIPPRRIITPEIARALTELSKETGRQIAILVDRRGNIEDVIMGDARSILIAELGRYRVGKARFRGLRCLHTHLRDEPLTQEDLTDLALLRFDLMAAIQVLESGLPGLIHQAHLLPPGSGEQAWEVLEPVWVHGLVTDFEEFIESLEEEFSRAQRLDLTGERRKRAILVGVTAGDSEHDRQSMEELAELASSADIKVLDTFFQKRRTIDSKFVLGSGKIRDLLIRSLQLGANLIIFDRELSGSQVKAISEVTDMEVIDRTQLILDIFARRARTKDGKIQVELAQLRYSLPRLVLRDDYLSRLTGGIGARGPGETKLEIYRRRIKERISHLEKEIDTLAKQRGQQRKTRERCDLPIISIIGYTNAGKSTLLNNLTRSCVFIEDRLFATLDPTTRRLRFPEEREVIITDTVGFIRDLPRDLMAAFRSTLEELRQADLLLHLVDISNPHFPDHIEAVGEILCDLALDNIPALLVFNKEDRVGPEYAQARAREFGAISISAIRKETLHRVTDEIMRRLWAERGKDPDAWPGEPESYR